MYITPRTKTKAARGQNVSRVDGNPMDEGEAGGGTTSSFPVSESGAPWPGLDQGVQMSGILENRDRQGPEM